MLRGIDVLLPMTNQGVRGEIRPTMWKVNPFAARSRVNIFKVDGCAYRIFDSAWTQRKDGVSSQLDGGSVQADSRRTGFAFQVQSKASFDAPTLLQRMSLFVAHRVISLRRGNSVAFGLKRTSDPVL
jgi:hypothetical protein